MYQENDLNLTDLLRVQIAWSKRTFGETTRHKGVLDHIAKELDEIREAEGTPEVLEEWIDVVLLALDGAWRAGYTAEEVCDALHAKAERNRNRKWGTLDVQNPDKAVRHVEEAPTK